MDKREKVIKGLGCCAHEEIGDCENCPYNENTPHCDIAMMRDAIALLKAQEPIKPRVEFNPAGQPMWCCGKCGTTLFFKFPRQIDDEDKRNEHRFCHYCGRPVKWE